MKPTPAERVALDHARTLKPMELEEASALSRASDLFTFARRHDRVRLAQTRLVWAAEVWNRRELQLSLYAHALREQDRTSAAYYRVTSLDRATAHIRHTLIDADRALAKAEESAYLLV